MLAGIGLERRGRPMTSDDPNLEHLRLLSIGHWVLAGVTALFACLPIAHVVVGVMLLTKARRHGSQDLDPRWIGWVFLVFGSAFVALGWTFAVSLAVAARSIARRRNLTFCLVVAFLASLCFPFGTVLGALTIVVLTKPPVRALFAPRASAVPIPASA
jgi:hypothetical protein